MAHKDLKVIPCTDDQREIAYHYVQCSKDWHAEIDPIRAGLGLKAWEPIPEEARTVEMGRLGQRLQDAWSDLHGSIQSASHYVKARKTEHLVELARQGRL